MPRVVVVQAYVPQYRRELFDGLRRALASAGVELDLVYSAPTAGARAKQDAVDLPWATEVPARRLGRFLVQGGGGVRRGADLVICGNAASHLQLYALMSRHLLGRQRLALWDHGRIPQPTPAAVERLKSAMARRVHWWFAYTEGGAEKVRARGFAPDRITVVQNAIDTAGLRAARGALTDEDRAASRLELGLGSGPVGVFVGGLYREKRIDFVLEAAREVRARVPGFQLLVVGDGPERHLVEAAAGNDTWIVAAGHRSGSAKVRALACADLLLIPSGVGLVVLDSFALELPMVTMAGPFHGPEIEYLDDGRNGVIVASPDRYAGAVAELLLDPARREAMAAACRQAAGAYTVEAMVERFTGGILSALAAPALR